MLEDGIIRNQQVENINTDSIIKNIKILDWKSPSTKMNTSVEEAQQMT